MAANLLDNGTIKDFREKIRMIVGIVIRFKVMMDALNLRDGVTGALLELGLELPCARWSHQHDPQYRNPSGPCNSIPLLKNSAFQQNLDIFSHKLDRGLPKLKVSKQE